MELNPNNPVARAAHDKWHLICAMLMMKFNVTHVEFKEEDIQRMEKATRKNIGISDEKGYVELFLLNEEETRQAIKKFGNFPAG